MSISERERLMEAFRLSHHATIQQIARHSEYGWLQDSKSEDVLVVFCSHRLTHSELELEDRFQNVPILVQFAPHLSFLNPDRHTEIMRRLFIENDRSVDIESASDPDDTESRIQSSSSLLKSFTSTYNDELRLLFGHTTISVAKLRDDRKRDCSEEVVVIITSDWTRAVYVEIALHGKFFQGYKILVLRDEWDDCSSARPSQNPGQEDDEEFDNAWQDPPLLSKIMLGAWMGDMTSSAIFNIQEINEGGKTRMIYPAMIQATHGFAKTDAERENPQLLVGKRVLDPGACLVKKTIRYIQSGSEPQPERRDYILDILRTSAIRNLTGSDDGLLNDRLRYTDYQSKDLRSLSVGKIRVVMQESDACFFEIASHSNLGRSLASPVNTLSPEGVRSRQFIREIITTQTGVLKQPKLTGTFDGGAEALIAEHENRNVLFFGARSGLKKVRLFECSVHVQNIWPDDRERLEDSDQIKLRPRSTWKIDSLVGMNAASRSRGSSSAAFGTAPAQGGDSSGPVFNSDGVFLGIVKGSWKGAGVSFMVPFSVIQGEANRKGMSLTLL